MDAMGRLSGEERKTVSAASMGTTKALNCVPDITKSQKESGRQHVDESGNGWALILASARPPTVSLIMWIELILPWKRLY
jgi:hypothetical protein